MITSEALGITRLEAVRFFVRSIDQHARFWGELLDLATVGESRAANAAATNQKSRVFRAGDATVVLTEPLAHSSRSARYLKRHPDGVGELVFGVKDVNQTYQILNERGATPTSTVTEAPDEFGLARWFSIATPFGDTLFTFVEHQEFRSILPEFQLFSDATSRNNRYGFSHIDHITSNFLTLAPMVLWCKNVLGLQQYWGIEFHTDDVATETVHGSGLKSIVLWDPYSGVKFANNEPLQPYFEQSQIYTFVEDNHGPGVQHIALGIDNIMESLPELRRSGLTFMPTPQTYYEMLPQRLDRLKLSLEESITDLQTLELLVDGEGPGRYLLQIFTKELSKVCNDEKAGPFFLEIIQRKGDRGFGGGNFRALFESIEREQRSTGRVK
ncbi:MAG: VOC family protein [Myxococcales bacterium]|nr:VOC family protein [Myxococcales bacterium]